MVSALDPLICDVCGEGFVELIDSSKQVPKMVDQKVVSDVDEEKKQAQVDYRIVFDSQRDHAHNRTDLYNRNTDNLYGSPTQRDIQRRRALRQIEEEKKA